MSPKDLVRRAFRFEETRPVPYNVPMEDSVRERLDRHYGSTAWRRRMVPYFHGTHFGFGETDLGDGRMRDVFGVVSRHGNIMHVLEYPLVEPTLAGYRWPEAETIEDWDALAADLAGREESYRCLGLGFGLFERAWLLRGMEALLVDMVEQPAFVDELLDGILDLHLEVMAVAARRLPLEAYFGGDDWSDQRGPMMGLGLWRRFFKPRLARMIASAHAFGLPYVVHSCGNVLPYVDDLLEIGLDGLESLQPEATDIFTLKRKTAGRMFLIGGLGVQSTMPFGSPDDVRQTVRRLIAEMGQGGGYLLSPAKPLLEDVPTENAAALLEVLWEQGP